MEDFIADIKAIIEAGRKKAHRAIDTAMLEMHSVRHQETDKEATKEEPRGHDYGTRDFIRNPTVLEFLEIPENRDYSGKGLDEVLVDSLRLYLLEIERGFAFVARQKHVRTETSEFTIDLMLYNFILRCFVIIKFNTTEAIDGDIDQLDRYVQAFDDLERIEGDNPTIGILIYTGTGQTVANYSVPEGSKQLFISKYLPYLPKEEELIAEIEREKRVFREACAVKKAPTRKGT